jgi:peptide/nickel transport system substrate-binding protein
MRKALATIAIGVLSTLLTAGSIGVRSATAQDLSVGLAGAITSIDPHFHNLGPNNNISRHIFDPLVDQDERQGLIPGLATAWRAIDDTTWEFTLRRGVKFHDGSEFTAEDVAATLRRVPNVPNSPSSHSIYTRSIVETIIVDPHTIRFRTRTTFPLLPNDLSNVYIISRGQESATTADFNQLRATNGTGPYRITEYAPGERVTLQRNDNYWSRTGASHWQRVNFRLIVNDPDSLARIRASQNLVLAQTASNRLIYLHVDSSRDQSPFVTDRAGAVLPNNPLKDVRVRRALSMAINRPAIVSRLFEGAAVPAGGFMPEGFFGSSPRLQPIAFDQEGARRLLAEAGYPNGFGLTIHGPNDRYIKDEVVLQAIGPMFSRIGIETRVVTEPWATYAARASAPNYSYSVMLVGWGAGSGEVSSPLRALVATVNRERGLGAANRGRYSNPRMDQVLFQALETIDDRRREQLLFEASELAIADVAIIPLHYQINIWGLRRGLTYPARADEYTLAHLVRPAN